MKNQEQQKENPVHLVDLINRLYVQALEGKVEDLQSTLGTYRGLNWAGMTTASDQLKIIGDLKNELDQALADILHMKAETQRNKGLVTMATAFLQGKNTANNLESALEQGHIGEFLNGLTPIYPAAIPRPTRIPNLNELSENFNK